jgi:hypothetical protein
MTFYYGNNCPGGLRLKNRRQRDYFQVGRVHQLDAKKLSLANANGPSYTHAASSFASPVTFAPKLSATIGSNSEIALPG